jgi:hypothetical protein
MAYKSTAETKEVLRLEKNDRGEYIVISSISEKEGGSTVDVRQYYTDKEGEVRPTQKGVRFNSEQSTEVVFAMVKAMDDGAREDFFNKLSEEYGVEV